MGLRNPSAKEYKEDGARESQQGGVLLVILGIILTAFGTVKLRQQVRNDFRKRAAAIKWRGGILVTAGLTSAVCGIAGGYRLIWGG
jgi:hypothetical protein